jgi:hypothetical protein
VNAGPRWLGAEERVRGMLRDDYSADEIRKSIDVYWNVTPRAEWQTCERLLTNRRRWEAGIEAAIREGRPPTLESIAEWAKVDPRTVQRWRRGG